MVLTTTTICHSTIGSITNQGCGLGSPLGRCAGIVARDGIQVGIPRRKCPSPTLGCGFGLIRNELLDPRSING